MQHPTNEPSAEKPLQGWKEIAAHLERDERTARRWELENGLPVRRHGKGRGSVYAFAAEIDAWRATRETRSEAESPATSERRLPSLWSAAVAVLMVAVAAVGLQTVLQPPHPQAVAAKSGVMAARQVLTGPDFYPEGRLSPDGTMVSTVDWSTGNLALQDLATGDLAPVTAKPGWSEDESFAETSAISPDRKRVAYAWFNSHNKRYELRVVDLPVDGRLGEPQVVFEHPGPTGYVEVAGWSGNDAVVFIQLRHESTVHVMTADLSGGPARQLRSLGWNYPEGVRVSPDGEWIAYGLDAEIPARNLDVFLLAADGSRLNQVAQHPADDRVAGWTPDGSHLLIASNRSETDALWAVPVRDGRQTGDPILTRQHFSLHTPVGVAPDGSLYYTLQQGATLVYTAAMDFVSGRVIEPPKAVAGRYVGGNLHSAWSPNGKTPLYIAARRGRNWDRTILIRDLKTGEERAIEPHLQRATGAAWSPDSSRVAFQARGPRGRLGLYQLEVESRQVQKLTELEKGIRGLTYLASGNELWYRSGTSTAISQEPVSHWIYNLKTGQTREAFPASTFIMSVSPDGKSYAAVKKTKGHDEIHLIDAATGADQKLLEVSRPASISLWVSWTPDGRRLLYWQGDGSGDRTRTLWTLDVETAEATATDLKTQHIRDHEGPRVHPDGKRIAFSAGDPKHELWKLENYMSVLQPTED